MKHVFGLFFTTAMKQSKFRISVIIASVMIATFILFSFISLGQGWFIRTQKTDFINNLSAPIQIKSDFQKHNSTPKAYLSTYDTEFHSHTIKEVGVYTTNDFDQSTPNNNEIWVTPALKQLIDSNKSLKKRYSKYIIKDKFPTKLSPSPDMLMLLFTIPDNNFYYGDKSIHAIYASSLSSVHLEQYSKDNSSRDFAITALFLTAVILITPLLILIVEATRIGIIQKEKKYAVLRLIGMTTSQIRYGVILETLPFILIGIFLGGVLFTWLGYILLSNIAFGGNNFWLNDLELSPVLYAVTGVAIVICAILACLQAVRKLHFSSLEVSRSDGIKKRPSILTTLLLIVSLGVLYLMAKFGQEWYDDNQILGGMIISILLLAILLGLFLGGSYITYLVSFIIPKHGANILAFGRLRMNARNIFHSMSGIIIALFIGSLLATFLATSNSVNNSEQIAISNKTNKAINSVRLPFQIDVISQATNSADEHLVNKLETNPRLTKFIQKSYIQRYVQSIKEDIYGAYYDSCTQLQQRTRLHCTEDAQNKSLIVQQAVAHNSPTSSYLKPKVIPYIKARDSNDTYDSHLILVAKDKASYRKAIDTISGILSSYYHETGDKASIHYTDSYYNTDKKLSASLSNKTILIMIFATVFIGGLNTFIGIIGSIIERKKVFLRLKTIGIGVSHLTISSLLEIVIPLIVLSFISICFGIFCCYCLLTITGSLDGAITFSTPGGLFFIAISAALILCTGLFATIIPILVKSTTNKVHTE